jgi:hypothetical protein
MSIKIECDYEATIKLMREKKDFLRLRYEIKKQRERDIINVQKKTKT